MSDRAFFSWLGVVNDRRGPGGGVAKVNAEKWPMAADNFLESSGARVGKFRKAFVYSGRGSDTSQLVSAAEYMKS